MRLAPEIGVGVGGDDERVVVDAPLRGLVDPSALLEHGVSVAWMAGASTAWRDRRDVWSRDAAQCSDRGSEMDPPTGR
jgi:hypothetical protein